jgi:hypothetical protein
LTRADFEGFFRSQRKGSDFFNTDYFQKVLEFVRNDELVKGVKFANDMTKVAPLVSFIMIYDKFFKERGKMTRRDRDALALCIRYIFCLGLNGGYEVEQTRKMGVAADYGYTAASIFTKEAR